MRCRVARSPALVPGFSLILVLGALSALACSETNLDIDRFPVEADFSGGVPIVRVGTPELDGTVRTGVVHSGAPLTTLDDGTGIVGRSLLPVEVRRTGSPDVVRARFIAVSSLIAPVGVFGDGVDASAVIGVDILARLGTRVDAGAGQLLFLPDLAGERDDFEDACDAVLGVPRRGGGAVDFGGTVIAFPPTRLLVSACFAPSAASCVTGAATDADLCACETGSDSILLLSTGLSRSVISEASWRRITGGDDAALAALPRQDVFLGNGAAPESLPVASLSDLYLLDDITAGRGGCGELFTHRLMERGGCPTTLACCPCPNRERNCRGPAGVEVASVSVGVLPDTHPLLNGLREELRPANADLEGILGMDVISGFIADFDYPNARMILRCRPGDATCHTRPTLSDGDRIVDLRSRGCLDVPF